MRVAVAGKHKSKNREIERKLRKLGFRIDGKRPEMIICNGGDGTLLYHERKHPGVPKVLLRGKHICRTCNDLTLHEMTMRLARGQYSIKEYGKLEAIAGRKRLICANDFVVRNKHASRALRFRVQIDGKSEGVLIGDGVVISTPFGSRAYFNSITRETFVSGIGIAYNNTTEVMQHAILPDTSVVKVTAVRENADLSCDNMARTFTLRSGRSITIRASKEKMRIVQFRR